jgi:hypothetical protein
VNPGSLPVYLTAAGRPWPLPDAVGPARAGRRHRGCADGRIRRRWPTVATVGVAVDSTARRGPYFDGPTAATVTAQALTRAGLAAQPFADLTIDVIRTSPKGKWHVPGDGLDRCQTLTRAYGYQPRTTELPVQAVSLLGEYDFCRWCAHRVTPPDPGGLLYTAARWFVPPAAPSGPPTGPVSDIKIIDHQT